MFLIDTMVLSELRLRQRDPGVVAWISCCGCMAIDCYRWMWVEARRWGPATPLERGLTVVTRNLRHFEPTGVAIINPWQEELER